MNFWFCMPSEPVPQEWPTDPYIHRNSRLTHSRHVFFSPRGAPLVSITYGPKDAVLSTASSLRFIENELIVGLDSSTQEAIETCELPLKPNLISISFGKEQFRVGVEPHIFTCPTAPPGSFLSFTHFPGLINNIQMEVVQTTRLVMNGKVLQQAACYYCLPVEPMRELPEVSNVRWRVDRTLFNRDGYTWIHYEKCETVNSQAIQALIAKLEKVIHANEEYEETPEQASEVVTNSITCEEDCKEIEAESTSPKTGDEETSTTLTESATSSEDHNSLRHRLELLGI